MKLPVFEDYSFEEKDDPRTLQFIEAADVDEEIFSYWTLALDLINVWASYQSKKKLYINATTQETQHKVWDVIVKTYNGDLRRLARHRDELSEKVDEALFDFRESCVRHGMPVITRKWLSTHLQDSRSYSAVRQKCRRRLEAEKPPQPLKDLLK